MAVARSAIKAPVATTAATSATTLASFITVGASDTILIVGIEVDSATVGTPTAFWDSAGTNQAMTQIGTTVVNSTSSPAMSLFLMGRVNPTPGLKSLSYTCPGVSGSPACYVTGITFTGSQTASVAAATEAFASNQGTAANATVSSAAAIPTGDGAVTVYNNIPGFTNAFTAGTNPGDGGVAIGKNETLTTNMAAESYVGAGAVINSSAANASSAGFAAITVGIVAAAAAAAGPGRTPASIFRPGQGPTRGLSARRSTFIPATGTTVSGDGASAGTGAANAVGAALFSGVGATSGVGTVAAVGQGIANSVGSSAGIGAAAAVGQDIANSVAASAGTGAATGIGASTADAVASSAGVGAAAAVGSSTTGADGVASSVGQATVAGISAALAASAAASSGIGAAAGVAQSLFAGIGNSAGVGTAGAEGQALAAATGSSAGVGTATGVGDSQAAGAATGASAGTAIVLGIGASLANSVAAATASSIVLGVAPGEIPSGGGGGAGVAMGTFTRKRWRELQELIAAEEAVAAKARKVGQPARARALREASEKAQDAIFALEGVEARAQFETEMAGLATKLAAATSAQKVMASIAQAREAIRAAAELQARVEAFLEEEDEEIRLLLE